MADDINTNDIEIGGATGPAESVAKKTRAPRRPKNTIGAASNAENASSDKPIKKTRAKRGSGKIARAQKAAVLASSQGRPAAPTKQAEIESVAIDEIADLLALEEENRDLRKQLSEKLRAENAELRKRLGQN